MGQIIRFSHEVALRRFGTFDRVDPSGADRGASPVHQYVDGLMGAAGRRSVMRSLARAAELLTDGKLSDPHEMPWWKVRRAHVLSLRAMLLDDRSVAPATANHTLSAVRGVLSRCWEMGLMETADWQAAVAVKSVGGSRLPRGRALSPGELDRLFSACADGKMQGYRDAAAFALMYGGGMRVAEAAGTMVGDYDAGAHTIGVIGKGNRERRVFMSSDATDLLDDWLDRRGNRPGAILCWVGQTGRIKSYGPMAQQSLRRRLAERARQAGIDHCSPHDLRRTFVTALLRDGNDLSTAQRAAGHVLIKTTALYDRRHEGEVQAAVERGVRVPRLPRGQTDQS